MVGNVVKLVVRSQLPSTSNNEALAEVVVTQGKRKQCLGTEIQERSLLFMVLDVNNVHIYTATHPVTTCQALDMGRHSMHCQRSGLRWTVVAVFGLDLLLE